jgi:hypothetical protein
MTDRSARPPDGLTSGGSTNAVRLLDGARRLVQAAAWRRRRSAVAQAGHLVLDFQFFSLEAGKEQVIRQRAVHLSVDLLLEKSVLVSKALDVILHGHPFAILRLESLTTLSV